MSSLLVYSIDSLSISHKLSKFSTFINIPTHPILSPFKSPILPHNNINPLKPNHILHKSCKISSLISQKMATCVDSSRAEPTKNCDSNGPQSEHRLKNYRNYCRPTLNDRVSYVPFSQNPPKPTNSRSNVVVDESDDDDIWSKLLEEAKSDVEKEPILSTYYYNSILSHKCLEKALATHLASRLSSTSLNSNTLLDVFLGVLLEKREIMSEVKADLRAVRERDPACISYVQCFLNFKGFLACQAHRIAHELWIQGRKILALLIQNRVSEVFAVDIHPGAKIGRGILLDHATGLVVGETAVIGNNVSILHNVTLGGTGKMCGDRHPKIGDGVLIGAGTCVLGNVRIGDGAKIGAGSVVLKEVPPRTTAVGNPARLIGGQANPVRLDKIPSFTMDHTSHINQWSDYVI